MDAVMPKAVNKRTKKTAAEICASSPEDWKGLRASTRCRRPVEGSRPLVVFITAVPYARNCTVSGGGFQKVFEKRHERISPLWLPIQDNG